MFCISSLLNNCLQTDSGIVTLLELPTVPTGLVRGRLKIGRLTYAGLVWCGNNVVAWVGIGCVVCLVCGSAVWIGVVWDCDSDCCDCKGEMISSKLNEILGGLRLKGSEVYMWCSGVCGNVVGVVCVGCVVICVDGVACICCVVDVDTAVTIGTVLVMYLLFRVPFATDFFFLFNSDGCSSSMKSGSSASALSALCLVLNSFWRSILALTF